MMCILMDETRTTLLLRLKDADDQTAWRTFDRLYRPMIVGYACSRGLDPNDAEDVAQECVQAVLAKIGEYEHLASFKTWLRSITEKKICDLFRLRKRHVRAETSILAARVDEQLTPPEEWERHWWAAHLRHCAEAVRHEISDTTYAAFVAYAIEEQPADAVAVKLGMTRSQVYVAKHRVLDRIRDLMLDLTGCDLREVAA